jgi:predicted nucleic acid-binding protein
MSAPMATKVFLDTNVLVYAFDETAPEKKKRAREIMSGQAGLDWEISWQVVQEFCHVALHRFVVPVKQTDLMDYLTLVLWPRCRVLPYAEIYAQALTLQQQTQYRFYDALILAAAIRSGAKVLYSEDLQEGRHFGDLKVENPF